ncbi:MAG: DNA recombination protein RmuC [Saprospiraceae bacterium]|uniref:DNA recombination protein RmuC n=1 Tax=Candidatus Opimibacter skivensis TaxID=2982028 RepID=A0A9D7XPK3_9BACT|nr:DNA recombination protein RmuC [Candidatus Opimibacter skivensis]
MSGLEKKREYFVQENFKDEHGNNVRPDIIVRLPDERDIILDSQVSLNAYLRYSESETKERTGYLHRSSSHSYQQPHRSTECEEI